MTSFCSCAVLCVSFTQIFVLKASLCPKANNTVDREIGSRQAVKETGYRCHGYMAVASSWFIACPLGRPQYGLHCTAPPPPIPPPHTHTHLTSAYLMPRQNQTLWPKLTEHMLRESRRGSKKNVRFHVLS